MFRTLGIVGHQIAVLVAVVVSVISGVALGVCAVAGISYFAGGLLVRRSVTGRERLVLIEYVWVALCSVTGFFFISGTPIRAGLDLTAVALCACLAVGRVGCAMVGCRHRPPADVGIVCGAEHGLSTRITGRPLLPVQLVEATTLAGFALATDVPGSATIWFLVAYAKVWFECEALQRDHRPTVLGVSVSRLMCVAQVAVALLVGETWLVPGRPGGKFVAGAIALVVAAASGVVLSWHRRNRLPGAWAFDEIWERIQELGRRAGPRDPVVGTTSSVLRIAVTAAEAGLPASLPHPRHGTSAVPVALRPTELWGQAWVTRLMLGNAGAEYPVEVAVPVGPVSKSDAAADSFEARAAAAREFADARLADAVVVR